MSGFDLWRRLLYKEKNRNEKMDDRQLLDRYVKEGSQEAFAELVARHLNFVYSAALRQVRAPHAAQDVTQMVFTNLARKAGSLPRRVILAGWLHRDTRFTALDLLRSERRRHAREQEAIAMTPTCQQPEPEPDWEQLRPWLDETLDQMNPLDRDALLLRFFEQRSLREIGVVLGSGEEAARKRVARALGKLRELLIRRGVTASASALSLALTANGIHAAPPALASTIAASSLAAGGTVAGGLTALHLIKTASMTASQLKTVLLAAVAVAGITTAILQHQAAEKIRAQNRQLLEQNQGLAQAQEENQRLSNLLAQANSAALSKDQTSELLRLRGQVGQLRAGLRDARAAFPSNSLVQNPAPAKTDMAAPASQPFTATFTARIPTGQTLLTGGWSTAPGKRSFVLMTPVVNSFAGGNPQVTVTTSTIEMPEAMLSQFDIAQLKAEGRDSSVQTLLNPTGAGTLLKTLNDPPDGVLVTHAKITTADGMASQMTVIPDPPANGDPPMPAFSISLTPNVTLDHAGVDMAINAELTPPPASRPK
jgi:RNA polymerase sigma factor (sigma-70 family)